jgi:FKBP-type peptidyl-prolyl cis-trans isomerase (trigger factor)
MAKQTTKKNQVTKNTNQTDQPALIGPNKVITLTVEAKDAAKAYQKSLAKLAGQVKIAGFRKGMVPTHLAEKELGETTIIDHALEIVIPPLYKTEVVDKKLESLTQPEFKAVKLEKDSDWVVEIHLAQKPEINLKDLQKIVKEGKKSGQEEAKKQEKESKDHKHHDHDDHEGHNHDHDHDHQQPSTEDIILTNIYQKLVTSLKPVLPELLVKEEVRAELQSLVSRLQSLNLTLDKYLQQQGMVYDDLTNHLAISAVGRLQLMFILDAISLEANLEATDAQVEAEIQKIAPKSDAKDTKKPDPQYVEYVRQNLKRRLLSEYLLKM